MLAVARAWNPVAELLSEAHQIPAVAVIATCGVALMSLLQRRSPPLPSGGNQAPGIRSSGPVACASEAGEPQAGGTQPDSRSKSHEHRVLQAMPDGYLRVASDGRLEDANPAACRQLGYSAEQLLSMSLRQLQCRRGPVEENLAERLRDAVRAAEERIQTQLQTADGQVTDMELTVIALDSSGEDMGILLRETTQLRRDRQSLRLRSAAVDSATDGIVICSAEAGVPVIDMNPATERITGYSRDELLGQNLRQLEGPDSDEAVAGRLQQSLLDGTGFEGEIVHYRRNGDEFWNRLHITPIHDESGELTHFIGILTDISRAKKADFALRESEAMLRSVTQSATDFILLTDLRGEILFANRPFPALSVEKVVGTSVFEHIPADACGYVKAAHEHVIATQDPGSYELAYRVGNNEMVLLESIVSPIVRFEEVIGLTISSRDVTTQRRLQKQLERSQRLASLGTLAGGIAHEINNPMAAAWTAAEAAQRFLLQPGQEDLLAECLDAVGSSVQRCQVIIDNVLRVARRQHSIKEPSDINQQVMSAVAAMRETSPPGASLNMVLGSQVPPCVINADEIQQVLINLMRNALQSGSDVDVTITTQAADDVIIVRVVDNGCGIEEGDLKQIFDPFFTTRGGTDGTGLGLAICHAIIEDHGGLIDVESQVGKGTIIAVSLPLPTASTDPADHRSAAQTE